MLKKCVIIPLSIVLFSFSSICAMAQRNGITGIVKNENNQIIVGANVRLVNTDFKRIKIAESNDKGVFRFENVPVGGPYNLIISYVGMVPDTLSGYNLNENSKISISVILKKEIHSLNEIVVIGYGSVRRQDLSSAVSVVGDLPKLKSRPVNDLSAMIQGKVPGVTIVNNGGHPSSSPSITIRGVGSKGTESVLYVVDGVPNAPFNPSDVESITVLKDAASSAIYGAFSGSAGVILITTKQATRENPTITYDGFYALKSAWKKPQSLTASQEAMVSNLADKNAGLPTLDGWNASINPDAQVTRTDWIKSIFRTAAIQRHTITINSGNEKSGALIEGRYENNEGTLLNTFNKNLSLRLNAYYNFNKHFSFRQELFWNNNDNRDAETSSGYSGVILSAIYMPRSATVYYSDGTFGGVGPRDSKYLGIYGDVINPVGTLLRNQPYNKTAKVMSVSEMDVKSIIPGLDYYSRFSYNTSNWFYKSFTPKRTEPGKPNNQNILTYSTDKSYNWLWENTANYSKHIDRHSIAAMISMTAQKADSRGFSASARDLSDEDNWAQFFVNAATFDQDRPSDYAIVDKNVSYVGRISYSWADRYFLTGSYRYDRAGRLAQGFRGKGFPGLTAAWKISSEPFFHVGWIDLLKLRGSWGRIGNIGSIGYYYGYPTLSQTTGYQVGDGAPLSTGLYLSSSFNPSLSWETSEQTDFGADLMFFSKRLNVTVDYFNKLTYNLIQQQTSGWTQSTGLSAPYINQGKISNKGLELAIDWSDKIGKINYEVGGNIATLKNRVKYIDGNPSSIWVHSDNWRGVLSPYRSTVGQPYYSYWLIQSKGIFQSDQEAKNYALNGTPIQPNAHAGDLKFVDKNGDGKIDDNDRVYMGNAFPKLTYEFHMSFNYEHFDLSMSFQGVSGVKLFNAFKESTLNASEQGYNRWNKILNAWSPTNTHSGIPIISAEDNNSNFGTASDWYLESGDYLRLKTLMLGYDFNLPFKNVSLRVYLTGENLLTLTKYSGMDPEVGGIGLDGGQYPVSRVYSIGASLKF